jgi:hypothetical protein
VPIPPRRKKWRFTNFRLDLTGTDTSGVTRIEAFTIRRTVDVVRSAPGSASLVARAMQIPDLVVTVAAGRAKDWRAWHRQVVVDGNQGGGAERDGALVFLSPDLSDELSRIELRNLGIFRFAGTDDPSRVVAHLYCEQMTLTVSSGP